MKIKSEYIILTQIIILWIVALIQSKSPKHTKKYIKPKGYNLYAETSV